MGSLARSHPPALTFSLSQSSKRARRPGQTAGPYFVLRMAVLGVVIHMGIIDYLEIVLML